MGLNVSMQLSTTDGPMSLVIQLAQTPAELTIMVSEDGEPIVDESDQPVVAN